MTTIRQISLASALLLSVAASHTHAALYDRGNGMIYDSTLNITWLQDSNYGETSNAFQYGATWEVANAWVQDLVYGGFSDWRLPSAGLTGNDGGKLGSNDGSTDRGYNNTHSEVGHLFIELGNTAYCNIHDVCRQPGYGFNHTTFVDPATGNTVGFLNISLAYWEQEADPKYAGAHWFFGNDGQQESGYGEISAWAVRDGDVAAVPIPPAAWLFGSGLAGLAVTSRRKARTV